MRPPAPPCAGARSVSGQSPRVPCRPVGAAAARCARPRVPSQHVSGGPLRSPPRSTAAYKPRTPPRPAMQRAARCMRPPPQQRLRPPRVQPHTPSAPLCPVPRPPTPLPASKASQLVEADAAVGSALLDKRLEYRSRGAFVITVRCGASLAAVGPADAPAALPGVATAARPPRTCCPHPTHTQSPCPPPNTHNPPLPPVPLSSRVSGSWGTRPRATRPPSCCSSRRTAPRPRRWRLRSCTGRPAALPSQDQCWRSLRQR